MTDDIDGFFASLEDDIACTSPMTGPHGLWAPRIADAVPTSPDSSLWYACSEPERPTDAFVLWHYAGGGVDCTGCRVKADLLLRQYPEDTHVQWVVSMIGREEA